MPATPFFTILFGAPFVNFRSKLGAFHTEIAITNKGSYIMVRYFGVTHSTILEPETTTGAMIRYYLYVVV